MSDNHEEAAYYLRFIRMYIDLATDAVLKVFFHVSPSQSVDTLFASDDVKKKLKSMRKTNILSRREYELVSRPHIRPASFDLSLLITLLTNLFAGKLTAPKNGWKLPVCATDHTIAADLLRLREIRNKILAHQPIAKLIKSKFERLWDNAENILVRLTQQLDSNFVTKLKEKINDYANTHLDPNVVSYEKYQDVLQEWFDDVMNLQVKVEELSNRMEELHLYFKTKPAWYSRYIRLLLDGGKLVLCGLLRQLLSERDTTLEIVLQDKCSELREKIEDEKLLKQLFPNTEETNLDIDRWDIAVLACVAICILNDIRNSAYVIRCVTIILKARRSYADSALVALDHEKFSVVSGELLSSISFLSSKLDDQDLEKCMEIIAIFNDSQRILNESDAEYFEELMTHGPGIRSIVDISNETSRKLKDYVKTMEDTGIPFQKYHILDLKIVTLGNNEERRKVVEDSVATVWQAALEKSGNSSDFPTVRESLDIILNDIRRIPGVEVDNLRRKCILFSLKCKSWRAIFQLVEYFESAIFKQELQTISIEMSLLQDEVISIQGHLTLESVLDILNRPQTGDDTAHTLCVPIKCSSVRGMKEVLKVLSNEETTNRFNQIADTLSHAERETSLNVFPEVYGFKEVFSETDSGSGGSSCEDEKGDTSLGNETISEHQQFIPDSLATKTRGAMVSTAEADDIFAEKGKVISEENPPALFQETKYKDKHQHAIEMEKKNLKLQTVSLSRCDFLFSPGENPYIESCEIRNNTYSHTILSSFSVGILRAVNLKTLKLDSLECSDSDCEGHVIDLSRHEKLHSVTIRNCNGLLLSDINPHLETCEIVGLNYSHEMLLSFSSGVSRAVNLKTLKLVSLKCSKFECEGHVIDLSRHEKLQSITIENCKNLLLSDINPHLESCELYDFKYSHEMLSSLLSGILRAVNLKTLQFDYLKCSKFECEGHVIDLSKHEKLQSVTIENYHSLLLSDINPNLESCRIQSCKYSHEMLLSFTSGISRAVYLKTLNFDSLECSDSDCEGHVIDLSRHEKLHSVTIRKCNGLLLSDINPHLETCEIVGLNYSHEMLSSFSSGVSRAVNLKTLKLVSLKCSKFECEGHVIDLSRHEKLQSITVENCKNLLLSDINPHLESCELHDFKYSHEMLSSFLSGISHAVNIKTLKFDYLKCSKFECEGHVIDLSKHEKLQSVTIENYNSLLLSDINPHLESCKIRRCTYSHEMLLSFLSGISHAVDLKTLKLDKIECSDSDCEGHVIDLSKHEKLQSVKIEDCKSVLLSDINPNLESCTVSGRGHDSLLSLSSDISCAVNLNKLKLKSVHCSNIKCKGHVIDLSNLKKLQTFAIINCDNLYVKNLNSVHYLDCLEINYCNFSHDQWLLISVAVKFSVVFCKKIVSNRCSSDKCEGHRIERFGQTHNLTEWRSSRDYRFHQY